MRNSFAILVFAAGAALAQDQVKRAIHYDWTFPQGNLIANWSFENEDDEDCISNSTSDLEIDCHYPFSSAPSGSRVMFASMAAASSSTPSYPHRTDFVRVQGDSTYSLSVQVNLLFGSATALGKIQPAVEFFTESKVSLGTLPLAFYNLQVNATIGTWQAYAKDFAAPSTAAFARSTRRCGSRPNR